MLTTAERSACCCKPAVLSGQPVSRYVNLCTARAKEKEDCSEHAHEKNGSTKNKSDFGLEDTDSDNNEYNIKHPR